MTPLAVVVLFVTSSGVALFALWHAVRARRELDALDAALMNLHAATSKELSDLRRNVGTHPAGASNAVSLHDLVQTLARQTQDSGRRIDRVELDIRALEHGQKPPAKKRGTK